MAIKLFLVYGFVVGTGMLISSVYDLTKKVDIGNIITLMMALGMVITSVIAFVDVYLHERELRKSEK